MQMTMVATSSLWYDPNSLPSKEVVDIVLVEVQESLLPAPPHVAGRGWSVSPGRSPFAVVEILAPRKAGRGPCGAAGEVWWSIPSCEAAEHRQPPLAPQVTKHSVVADTRNEVS